MMQIVPYTIVLDNQEIKAYFILGVATNKNYQKQGMMKKLMNYVLNLPKYAGQKILLQAYMPEIYYNFGFNIIIKLQMLTKNHIKMIMI